MLTSHTLTSHMLTSSDTVGFLDALKIQKADVLGFSMASFITQEITLLHPEKVNRLILMVQHVVGKGIYPKPHKL